MIDALNIAFALVSVALGGIGWLAPRYTMAALDLEIGASTMGLSEIRAASGALYVGAGLGAIVLATPAAFAMLGFVWAGAALGRATSIVADDRPTRLKWSFFGIETAVAASLLLLNL